MAFEDIIKYVEIREDGTTTFIGGSCLVRELRK